MNTIKFNGTDIKLLGEDDKFYYTEDITKKFTFGLYSSRCAFPKDNNKYFFVQRKLNWWNPLIWLIEIFWFCKTFVMEGFYGIKELVDSYDKESFINSFKYESHDIQHVVSKGYTLEK